MNRTAGRTLAALIVCLSVPVVAPADGWWLDEAKAQAGSEGSRPNILLIVTDDQPDNPDTRAVLPVLERFPLRFNRAYVTTPLCCPSRASIFSGRYAHNHGIVENNGQGFDQDRTVQRTLHDNGYATGLVGKYLNKVHEAPHFDHVTLQTSINRFYDSTFLVDGEERKVRGHMSPFLQERALTTMDQLNDSGKPWFLYVGPYAPHLPATPERKYEDRAVSAFAPRRETNMSDKPAYVRGFNVSKDKVSEARKLQLRSLASVNDLTEALLDRVEQLGAENTMVIFTSDNGYMWWEHGLFKKRFPYEPSVRVPLYVRWPGRVTAGSSDRLVANIDIAATIYEAAGVEPTYPLDGRSLFAGGRDHLLLEYWAEACCRVPSWKAIVTAGSTYIRYETGERELYNMLLDPDQLTNQVASAPGLAERLESLLVADASCVGSACP